MSTSNGTTEPNERTSLLSKDDLKQPIDPSLSISANGEGHSNGSGPYVDEGSDEEAGSVEEQENPLYEGQPEMVQRMYLLFPAVSIGVSLQFSPYSQITTLTCE